VSVIIEPLGVVRAGLEADGHSRFTDYSYLGLFVPWTVRTLLDCSYHGLFVRSLDFSYPGLFVPWTVRTLLDCSYHGLFVPSLDDSYHVEKDNIVYTV